VSNADRTCTKKFHITLSGYFGPITPDIDASTASTSFGNFPNGLWRVYYLRGAIKYTAAFGWAVDDTAGVGGNGYRAIHFVGIGNQVSSFFATGQFATQAECEAANEGRFAQFLQNAAFPPQPIAVSLDDSSFPYAGHVPGNPNPQFLLVPV